MILVDTSAWLDFFRGREPLGAAVDALLENDQVAVCGPIFTELRRGLRSARERARVRPLLGACHELAQPTMLWDEAADLGSVLSRKGSTVKKCPARLACSPTSELCRTAFPSMSV